MDIAKRFHRIIAIYFQLQGRSVVKAQDLSEQFEVSVRTIYRDMKALEQAGIPIYGEAGTGYSLSEGYKLPPTSFTAQEIRSLATSEKLMQKFVDHELFSHFNTAIGKIRSYFRYSEKNSITALEENVYMNAPKHMFNEAVPGALSMLFESISLRKKIKMEYRALDRQESATRQIEPVGVYHEGNFWYFLAYCHLRKDYRRFRIDRIIQIWRTDEPYGHQHKPLRHFLEQKEAPKMTTVIISVDKEIARYIQYQRQYHGFIKEELIGDQFIMHFRARDIDNEFARWYLMFADRASIIEPQALKDTIRQIVANIKI
ncbi:MAG: helix-turn-helix transcriptional regulator [Sphingobacterium sp.]|uniref:helix-turn-helix transcriptional regulator n=1 Tax=Sphingobacterium sp. JB170 TaxID=1434842 RepID=UPI00097EB34C|nr:YafY family protein [Sphingobacterium sp. JB170]SJN27491.1 Transcriptional regulator, DeoR family [Sphingobacterium sp. JB170]